ncbi:MAG TPA: DNA-binding protein [Flavobacteriaceae bacterium]|nr:DNA-binding protein [Flavobacteriaceae bacterium]
MNQENQIPEHIEEQLYFMKPILTFEEACKYTGLSKSCMYKHTHRNNIAFHKPNNKKIYFKRTDLDNFMLQNRQASNEEISRKATKQSLTA